MQAGNGQGTNQMQVSFNGNKSPHINKSSLHAIAIHQQAQKLQMQTQYHPHGLNNGIIALSNPSGAAQNNNASGSSGSGLTLQKGVLKKKIAKYSMASPHNKLNGMLAALNPSGTIHVTGMGSGRGLIGGPNSSTISVGMMSTDFKNTMKHNSSNNSIQGTKKNMISTIRKPTDFIGLTTSTNIKKGSNYMSPYSQKIVTKNNTNHNATIQ